MKSPITFLLLLCCILMSGCASIIEREGMFMDDTAGERRSKMSTPIFAGTATDAGGIAFGLAAPFICWFSEDVEGWEVLQAPLCLIDLAPSLIADVIYLPGDIDYWIEQGNKNSEQDSERYRRIAPNR